MAFSENVLYRISSNEVNVITSDSIVAGNSDNAIIVITDFPDGMETRSNDSLRVLGTAKILDGTTVRNATQEEIDTFLPAVLDDYAIRDAQQALKLFNSDVKLRKILAALIKGIIKEDNENRLWIRDFKDVVAASTSLANLQSRVAALDTPVDREFQDAKDYIISQVSKDD